MKKTLIKCYVFAFARSIQAQAANTNSNQGVEPAKYPTCKLPKAARTEMLHISEQNTAESG